MKITKLKTFVVGGFRCNWVFVKLYTDAGIEGVGEATLEFNEQAVAGMLSQIGDYLVGKDPFAIDAHRETIIRSNYWRTNVVLRSALSGIEGALHDIKGKALSVPVYELLGGLMNESLPVYANTWRPDVDDRSVVSDKAARMVDAGFRAVKFDPFFPAHLHMSAAARAQAVGMVAAVREAVGPEVEVLVEGHGRFDIQHATMIATALEPLAPYWFEEPVLPECLDALADLRRRTRIPIAAGERIYDVFRVADLLRRDAVDVLQPDICHVGGLGVLRQMALLAHSHGRAVAPHNVNGPVGNAMTLHVAATLPNVNILETCSVDAPWRCEITTEDVWITDGRMRVPNKPGLGLELNEAVLDRFPPREIGMHHYAPSGHRPRASGAVPWYHMSRTGTPGHV